MQHLDYLKLPKVLIEDDKLNNEELGQLVRLFSQIEIQNILAKKRWLIKKERIKNTELFKSLYNKGWLDKKEDNIFLKIPKDYLKHNISKREFEQKGSKIARNWDKYFGTLNLTPTFLQKLISFIDDGISEEVIVEVLKISSKKAKGNPTNYITSLLRDYLNRSIYTIHDFKEEKQRMEEYEKRLQEINRKKEKRDEEETLEDYYKKGYK